MIDIAQCRNPVGVELVSVHLPRVARSSQPWALMRNPFGIGFGNETLLDSKSRISRVSNECKVYGREAHPLLITPLRASLLVSHWPKWNPCGTQTALSKETEPG